MIERSRPSFQKENVPLDVGLQGSWASSHQTLFSLIVYTHTSPRVSIKTQLHVYEPFTLTPRPIPITYMNYRQVTTMLRLYYLYYLLSPDFFFFSSIKGQYLVTCLYLVCKLWRLSQLKVATGPEQALLKVKGHFEADSHYCVVEHNFSGTGDLRIPFMSSR